MLSCLGLLQDEYRVPDTSYDNGPWVQLLHCIEIVASFCARIGNKEIFTIQTDNENARLLTQT